jgi:hypothetical protein
MSALYKSGTVTVTNGSNIVTGSGTSFISIAGIVPGALFTINGVNWYEVYEVNTNTQIKVRTIPAGQTFQQATASGQDYAIFQNFTSLSPTEIAARVVAIQQKWHIREEEMTDWFASTNDFEEITNINGDKITVMTPFGVNNLLGTAATRNVGTSSGNVMEVGAFGLGSLDCPTISDLTQEVQSGLYKFRADYTGAPPDTASTTLWYSVLVTQSLQDRVTFIAQLVTGSAPRLFLGERVGQTGSIRWVETYNSGNSVNPLDYGLGTNSLPTYTALGTNKSGTYVNSSQTAVAFIGARDASRSIKLEAKATGSNDSQISIQHYDGTTGTEFYNVYLYHSGNTNFNEFYSTGVGDILASGYAFNTTSCVFNFPINSLSLPNGVTISGTEGFEIADRNTQTLLHNNVTNLVMTARVAPKTLALEVTGLSGFTTGQELVLRSRVGSKITVNF